MFETATVKFKTTVIKTRSPSPTKTVSTLQHTPTKSVFKSTMTQRSPTTNEYCIHHASNIEEDGEVVEEIREPTEVIRIEEQLEERKTPERGRSPEVRTPPQVKVSPHMRPTSPQQPLKKSVQIIEPPQELHREPPKEETKRELPKEEIGAKVRETPKDEIGEKVIIFLKIWVTC